SEEGREAVIGPHTVGVSVGKVRQPADIVRISKLIGALERRRGLPEGRIRLLPWIETAEAIVRCHEILTADRRIMAAAFGAEDFTHDMGIERGDDETAPDYARRAVRGGGPAARAARPRTP